MPHFPADVRTVAAPSGEAGHNVLTEHFPWGIGGFWVGILNARFSKAGIAGSCRKLPFHQEH